MKDGGTGVARGICPSRRRVCASVWTERRWGSLPSVCYPGNANEPICSVQETSERARASGTVSWWRHSHKPLPNDSIHSHASQIRLMASSSCIPPRSLSPSRSVCVGFKGPCISTPLIDIRSASETAGRSASKHPTTERTRDTTTCNTPWLIMYLFIGLND